MLENLVSDLSPEVVSPQAKSRLQIHVDDRSDQSVLAFDVGTAAGAGPNLVRRSDQLDFRTVRSLGDHRFQRSERHLGAGTGVDFGFNGLETIESANCAG